MRTVLLADASMRELGQFLAGPGALFNEPSPFLLLGLGALGLTLILMVVFILRPMVTDARSTTVLAVIPFVALGAVLLVLFTQWLAQCIRFMVHRNPVNSLRSVAHGSGLKAIGGILFLIFAYIISWGYSRSLMQDSFEEHILSYTVGTGLLEELVKGVASFIFLGALGFNSALKQTPRLVILVAFTLGGLSFGAGEAVFYFQAYAGLEVEPGFYLLRGSWCVLLHGAWSFLSGLLFLRIVHLLDQVHEGVATALFIACCLPAAMLHGLYDAACLHSLSGMWTLGGLSIGFCLSGLLLLRRWPEPTASGGPQPAAPTNGNESYFHRMLLDEHMAYAKAQLNLGHDPETVLQKLVVRGLSRAKGVDLLGKVLMEFLVEKGLEPEQATNIVQSFLSRHMPAQGQPRVGGDAT